MVAQYPNCPRKPRVRARRKSLRLHMEAMEPRLVLSVVSLHAGDDLQAAINSAQPGDTLILDAGATFTGPITLPNKTGDQWITIESSALNQLPGAGQRVSPQDASLMPKITSPGLGEPALQTSDGAHNFRFIGIEFLPATDSATVYDLIDLGDGSGEQTSLSQVPHDLTIDRCYVHAWLDQPIKRGIALNSANTQIINSYISGFKVDGQDSQAIAGWNGPGPFTIDNNYLEAAGENILFGGAYATIPNLIPSNIQIEGNLVTKPLSWNSNDPTTYGGTHWTVKNLLELKNAQNVTVEGNQFENNWLDAQTGFAIVMTPRGDQSGGSWVTVSNVTFTNNIVAHSAQGVDILGSDDSSASQFAQNLTIQNNLFEDIGASRFGATSGRAFEFLPGNAGGSKNVTVDHNTVDSDTTLAFVDGVHTGFVFTNNIAPNGAYGIYVNALGDSLSALQTAFPGGIIQGNVIAGGDSSDYPSGNYFPATMQDVGFVNFSGGNYSLSASSSYISDGTNGTSPGVNMTTLDAALNQQPAPPIPTPTPVSASRLVISGLPSSVTAGSAVTFTVTATDANGNTASGYTGTIHFTSSDGQAVLPADYTFTAADNGVHTFSITFKTAGTASLTATDTATSSITGSQAGITVTPAAVVASRLVMSGLPSSITAGSAVTFTVTATDANGNTATGYTGTVHFTSSDGQAVLPADYTFTAADKGVHTFTVTFKTAGTESLTVTDKATSSITGSQTGIAVTNAAVVASRLVIAGLPSSVTVGSAVTFTVTATDANGTTATGYTGTVHFTSSDGQAVLPADYTFTAADKGVHTFTVTFKTAGTATLTVTDKATSSITGTQTGISVTTAAAVTASRLVIAGLPSTLTAGTAMTFTVTATNANGNTATGYRGTVHFTSSDGQAILPADYTFTAADNGVHTFTVTFKTPGTVSLTATDMATRTLTTTTANITVKSVQPTRPSTTTPSVTYHGGPLLQNVQVQTVYYGQAWSTNALLGLRIPQVDGFLEYFTSSPYMDVLKQYNVGYGTFDGHDIVSQVSASNTIDDSQIRALLNAEITAQRLQAPGPNQLYVFMVAPGTVVTADGQSSVTDFGGYHSFFTDSAGAPVYYVVVPYPTGNVAPVPLTGFQQDTYILSHEISEAVTNPNLTGGWFSLRQGEIGDIAEGTFGVLNHYVVQGVWSQSAGRVVIPTDTSSGTVQVIGRMVDAVKGLTFTGVAATFTSADPAATTAASFTASINWGDGTTSTGTVSVDSRGGYDVNVTHTYTTAGNFAIGVTVTDQAAKVKAFGVSLGHVSATPLTARPMVQNPSSSSNSQLSGGRASTGSTNGGMPTVVVSRAATPAAIGAVGAVGFSSQLGGDANPVQVVSFTTAPTGESPSTVSEESVVPPLNADPSEQSRTKTGTTESAGSARSLLSSKASNESISFWLDERAEGGLLPALA
jgi:hypothetical protein